MGLVEASCIVNDGRVRGGAVMATAILSPQSARFRPLEPSFNYNFIPEKVCAGTEHRQKCC